MGTDPKPRDLLVLDEPQGAILERDTSGVDGLTVVDLLEAQARMCRILPEQPECFPSKVLNSLASKATKVLVIEMNLGQRLDDVKIAIEGKAKIAFHGRPAGGIPTPEEILGKVKEML